jgi:hypothetical protein
MGGGVSQGGFETFESDAAGRRRPSRTVWSLGLNSTQHGSEAEQPIDHNLTNVPTHYEIDPFRSDFVLQSKLGW